MPQRLLIKKKEHIFLSVMLIIMANDELLESLNLEHFHFECIPITFPLYSYSNLSSKDIIAVL